METRAAAAVWGADGRLTTWIPNQGAQGTQRAVAAALDISTAQVRVITPDVGGAFGAKFGADPEHVLVAWVARELGRPARWSESRYDNLLAMTHGRAQLQTVTIGGRRDGTIEAYRLEVLQDCGAYPAIGALLPSLTLMMAPGTYAIGRVEASARSVVTNTTPVGAYRGAGRPEATAAIERAVDLFAAEIGRDPVQVRRQNLLPAFDQPYDNGFGARYDSGDYAGALDRVLAAAGYDALRAEQRAARRAHAEGGSDGELMGIGIGFFTEAVGAGPRKHMDIMGLGMNDGAALRIHPTGKAQLSISVQTQGQGHETTFAQIVAEELGIPPEDVDVVHGDTDTTPYGLGTYGSRSTPVSGAATALAARKVRERARVVAAAMLEVSPDDLEWVKGPTARWAVKGDPEQSASLQDIALASRGSIELPPGFEAGLDAEAVYDPPNLTFPFGAYVCVVDIDPGTAAVTVRRFIAIDDCGTRINPMIIEGQVHGGLTDGVGMALMETIAYDEAGNCLAGTLMDYLIPTALEVPDWETGFTVTPSPHHPIGAKGIGESATVGSPPTIVNAICDALTPFGVRHLDMPCTPSRVWEAMHR
jgi:carbon-monoxide dehydrogenase large subunit